jgi:uncharacterized protein
VTEESLFRAVLDTNIIIAALKSKNPNSPNLELLERFQLGEFRLLYSDDMLLEYQEKFIARKINAELALRFLAELVVSGERVEVAPEQVKQVVIDDPDDDLVVACAVVGNATHLVTYDPHLLMLETSIEGIVILNGLHFLYAVRGDKEPD